MPEAPVGRGHQAIEGISISLIRSVNVVSHPLSLGSGFVPAKLWGPRKGSDASREAESESGAIRRWCRH